MAGYALILTNIVPYLVGIVVANTSGFLMWTLFFWVLEAFGIADFGFLWDIIDPNAEGEGSLADMFVELCTFWVGVSIETLAKVAG